MREGWGTQSICGLERGGSAAVRPIGFDFDSGGRAGSVVVEAAPAVVLGFGDQASGYRIAMDVADFFYKFASGEDIEIVVAGLPEVVAFAFEEFGGFPLEDPDGGGEDAVFGFAEEKVDVLGHDDVGVEGEIVRAAGLFDDLFENVFGFGGFEVGETVVTTECDEVELAGILAAF
jgi:hypothetical protein